MPLYEMTSEAFRPINPTSFTGQIENWELRIGNFVIL